jgi:hypothetical protein
LTWLENRHATLGESNLLKDKEVGVMQSDITGTEQAIEKRSFRLFDLKHLDVLSFNWQWTTDE